MTNFYNLETNEPITTMYIGSSRNGNIVLRHPTGLSMRAPHLLVDGRGVATPVAMAGRDVSRWSFTDLAVGSSIRAVDGSGNTLAQIPVKSFTEAKSFTPISERLNGRGMKIDLDSYIDYVCYASDILGEGISFRPKDHGLFQSDIIDTQLFHRDDRSDFFGKKAASATIGEGYREVSTPSLHVAISSEISSVHIDSYAFQFHAPDGTIIIG